MQSVILEMSSLLSEAKERFDLNRILDLPRFEFIAAYLVYMTSKKSNRDLVKGNQVLKKGKMWRVVNTNIENGKVASYETDDAAKLFDFARRGHLGMFTKEADNIRVDGLTDRANKVKPFGET